MKKYNLQIKKMQNMTHSILRLICGVDFTELLHSETEEKYYHTLVQKLLLKRKNSSDINRLQSMPM